MVCERRQRGNAAVLARRDGRRFLVNVLDPTLSAGSPDVVVVLDWAESMYTELGGAGPTRP